MAAAPASAYNFLPPPYFVYFDIKPETVKAIANAIVKTANKAKPSLWKSNKITSKDVTNIVTGISTEDNQIRFDIDVIGVTSIL